MPSVSQAELIIANIESITNGLDHLVKVVEAEPYLAERCAQFKDHLTNQGDILSQLLGEKEVDGTLLSPILHRVRFLLDTVAEI